MALNTLKCNHLTPLHFKGLRGQFPSKRCLDKTLSEKVEHEYSVHENYRIQHSVCTLHKIQKYTVCKSSSTACS